MGQFVGRQRYLVTLSEEFARVGGEGRLVLLRGRRQVGKSRLIAEFTASNDVPSAFFAATKGDAPARSLARFGQEVRQSSLDARDLVPPDGFADWEIALRTVAAAARVPQILVIDEFPYLTEQDPTVEGQLQTAWDRALGQAPVLVIVIGSDLAMMELLTTYGRPLYGRPTAELVLPPLNAPETADLAGLSDPETVIDAFLVTGGFPNLVAEWRDGERWEVFLRRMLTSSTSPLLVTGERMVTAEFPAEATARSVLRAIGAGEAAYSRIGDRAGTPRASLARALDLLVGKRVVQRRQPLSAKASGDSRYVIADPYLRFWHRFVEPGTEEILRGRGELVVERVTRDWPAYRGGAIEPLVRVALERMLPAERFGSARHVGGWWNRTGDVEVDLVGGEGPAAPTPVSFVGSVKWRSQRPFGRADLLDLAAARSRVPGAADARLVGVSLAGFDTTELDVTVDAAALLDAMR